MKFLSYQKHQLKIFSLIIQDSNICTRRQQDRKENLPRERDATELAKKGLFGAAGMKLESLWETFKFISTVMHLRCLLKSPESYLMEF